MLAACAPRMAALRAARPLPALRAAAAALAPRAPPRAAAAAAAAPLSAGAPAPAPRAAFAIIGDEVLSGAVADSNAAFLARLLHARGVDLIRVEVCPDTCEDIAETVLGLRRRVGPGGFVFTSGGIGPTHDDKTYAAVAAALGLRLERHAPTVAAMEEHYEERGLELNAARLRMATLPTPAEVLPTPGIWVPLVVAGADSGAAVHVLPGIPRLFSRMLEAHAGRFSGPAHHEAALYSNAGEGDVAGPLAEVAAAHPGVRIGSYLNTSFGGSLWRVRVAFESRDAAAVAAAAKAARAVLPSIVEVEEAAV